MAEKAPDPMRRHPRALNTKEGALMDSIKADGEELWYTFDRLGNSRELSLAKTKIEEAVMWAVKHITG